MAERQAAVWPSIYNERNRRIKGFYPKRVIDSEIQPLVDSIKRQISHPQATRICIRVIVREGLIQGMRKQLERERIAIEAMFPIPVLPGFSVVYLGYNKPGRGKHNYKKIEEDFEPMSREELEKRTSNYRILQVHDIGVSTADDFAAMFSSVFDAYPVDVSAESIRKMPLDHIVMAAYSGAELIAVFMADRATVFLDGTLPITFFDFVNVLSKKDGTLLVPLMARRIIEIANSYPNPVVFAEARADKIGLQICCARAGMRRCGILPSSSLMKDREDNEIGFRDTVVWYKVPEL